MPLIRICIMRKRNQLLILKYLYLKYLEIYKEVIAKPAIGWAYCPRIDHRA